MKKSVTEYLIWGMLMIFISGLLMGISFFLMNYTQQQLETVHCDIPNNVYMSNCQDMFSLSIYPFLNLKGILIWFNYFFIFALTIGMLMVGYNSGKNPALIGMLVVFLIVITFVSIEFSNSYRTMISNPLFYSMMSNFVLYDKIMLNFPVFIGTVGILAIMLSIVNFQKARVNSATSDLNY